MIRCARTTVMTLDVAKAHRFRCPELPLTLQTSWRSDSEPSTVQMPGAAQEDSRYDMVGVGVVTPRSSTTKEFSTDPCPWATHDGYLLQCSMSVAMQSLVWIPTS